MTTTQVMNKNIDYYMSLLYPILLIPDEDGYWFAEIPLLKGCMTNGEGLQDALQMLDDAKQGWLETALAHHMTIPEPDPEKTLVVTYA
ncbi:MAG: type II toxin-antitoxin system HicB family antitoxin [Chitinophagaceae bacterium]|nr:type II toxin-antitoxin system HicB family antitoxin [Anaerolineae bacterium]